MLDFQVFLYQTQYFKRRAILSFIPVQLNYLTSQKCFLFNNTAIGCNFIQNQKSCDDLVCLILYIIEIDVGAYSILSFYNSYSLKLECLPSFQTFSKYRIITDFHSFALTVMKNYANAKIIIAFVQLDMKIYWMSISHSNIGKVSRKVKFKKLKLISKLSHHVSRSREHQHVSADCKANIRKFREIVQ